MAKDERFVSTDIPAKYAQFIEKQSSRPRGNIITGSFLGFLLI